MVIALIGGQLAENKDDVKRNPGRWDYYLNMLEKHDYGYVKPWHLNTVLYKYKIISKVLVVKVCEENLNIFSVQLFWGRIFLWQ
jgi:hypothetical protein